MMRKRGYISVLLALVFCLLTIPLVLKADIDVSDARDEVNFHYPTTLAFIDQFPHLDLIHYSSATTPLYHIVLTLSSFVVGSGIIQLRLVSWLISLSCLIFVYRYFSRRGQTFGALMFALVFMMSPYFIGPAVRLSTDNVALLFALVSIAAMDAGRMGVGSSVSANVLILLAILTRQIYAWLIGAYLLVASHRCRHRPLLDWVKNLMPALIPSAGLLVFILLWRGLVTPASATAHTGSTLNWDVAVYILALLGLYGSFFFFWYLELAKGSPNKVILPLCLAVSIACLLLHPVSGAYDRITRGGSLWLVASRSPVLLSSAMVFWVLLPIGLCCLFLMFRYLVARRDYVMIVCFSLWLIANMVNSRSYQKYYEPFVLFFIGYVLVSQKSHRWYYWIGPGILIIGFAVIAATRFFLA